MRNSPEYSDSEMTHRLLDRISPEPMSGCWLWNNATDKFGYGIAWNGNKNRRAHRLSYVLLKGPIPDGLELDHKCRVKGCINPDHLEPVTGKENLHRSELTWAFRNKSKTHCPQGHPLILENLDSHTLKRGGRGCLECRRTRDRERKKEYRLKSKGVN